MSISKELLDILVCPRSKSRLVLSGDEAGREIRDRLERGEVAPRGSMDWKVSQITGFLVTEDGTGAYPIVEGVPNLLPGSSIPL